MAERASFVCALELAVTAFVLGLLAAGWGVVMALSPALQIRRMLATRSSRDVSVAYFALLVPGFLLWLAYGVATDDLVLAIPNAVSAVVAVVLISIAARLRHNPRGDPRKPATPDRGGRDADRDR